MQANDQEAQIIETYDKVAESWTKEHNDRSEYAVLVGRLKTYFPDGSILEIGAGGGADAELLAAAGYEYFGTDASQGMVAAASRRHPELTFRQLSVYDLSKLDQTFDGFWACAVLLHIPKNRIDEALQAIHTTVKPGGYDFISIKDGDRSEFEQRQQNGRQEDRLFVYWTKDTFTEVLARNGFKVVSYEYAPKSQRTNWHRFFVQTATEG